MTYSMKNSRYELDMCNGALAKKILLFALPLMLSSILQLLFNAADVVVVGRFCGKASLAAVGSTTSLINLLINLFVGLSVGANVVVAQDLGAGKKEQANRTVHTCITLAVVSGVFLMMIGGVLGRQMLEWMGSPSTVIDLAALYIRIYFLGMPATMVYNFGSAMLRSQGDTQRPLYYLTFAGVFNVVLNLFFIVVCHWNVAGVAAATIIAQYISAGLVLRCLMREEGALHLDLRCLRMSWSVVQRIVRVGLPAGFQGMLFSLSNVIIQSAINSFGDVIMAGSAASQNIEGFVYTAMNAFYQTAITFVGQNYGAGKCRRVDRVAVYCVTFAVLTGLIFGNAVYLLREPLLHIYSPDDPLVVQAGVERLLPIVCFYGLCGYMEAMVGVLRGLGYSVMPMITALVGTCAMRILWVAAVFPLYPEPGTLYVSYPITWALTGTIHLIVFLCVRKRAYRKVMPASIEA